MPIRPRQHQLETESRVAFQAALPSLWVYRDQTSDYGIDAEVELFDERGYATGEKFLVQLKATDESDLHRALSVSLPTDTAEYYESLRLPVLIVRYLAVTRQLFVHWFHAFERPANADDRKTVALRFTTADAWGAQTSRALAADIAAWRQMRASVLQDPVTFAVELEDGAGGLRRFELISQLRQAAADSEWLAFEPRREDVHSPNMLRVTVEGVEVTVAAARRFSVAAREKVLLNDSLTGIALAIATFGHASEAAEILARCAPGASVLRVEACAIAIAACLARANQQATLIALADELLDAGASVEARYFIVTFLAMQKRLGRRERLLGIDALERFAGKLQKQGHRIAASHMYYNAGVLLRELAPLRRAFRLLRRAAALDSSYTERHYFWEELAGILFRRRFFGLSATLYRRALQLKDSDEVAFLLADALLFSGAYAEAHQLFRSRLRDITEETAIWYLKLRAVGIILGTLHLEHQTRRPHAALACELSGRPPSDAQIERACFDALRHDALFNNAWFNLANVRARRGDWRNATMAYLLAAVSDERDVTAWNNLIGAVTTIDDTTMALAAQFAGAALGRQPLVRYLASRVPPQEADDFAEIFNIVVEGMPNARDRFIIRDHRPDGTWVEVVTPTPASAQDRVDVLAMLRRIGEEPS